MTASFEGMLQNPYLKLEVKTSTSPYCSVACSSDRPTEARGGLLKTALAMASYSAWASGSPLHAKKNSLIRFSQPVNPTF